jgi:hypothetical protein
MLDKALTFIRAIPARIAPAIAWLRARPYTLLAAAIILGIIIGATIS